MSHLVEVRQACLRTWSGLRAVALWLLRTVLAWSMRHYWMALAAWVVLLLCGATPWAVLAALGGLFAIAIAGRDAQVCASSVTQTITDGYRMTRIRRTWRRVMVRAQLYKTVTTDDAGVGKQVGYKEPARLVSIRPSHRGLVIVADGGLCGFGTDAFQQEVHKLRPAWRCRELLIDDDPTPPRQPMRRALRRKLDDGPRPYQCTRMRLVYGDPFAQVVLPSDLPAPSQPLHVVLGFDLHESPIEVSVWLPHLCGGGKGSGKSSLLWRLLRGIDECQIDGARLPWLARIFDPKGGQEMGVAAETAYEYERRPNKWGEFVHNMCRALEARSAALADIGERDWVNVAGDERFPLQVVVIDELVSAILQSKAKDTQGKLQQIEAFGSRMAILDALMMWLSQCRSAGFTMIAGTQIVQKEIIGLIRDQFDLMTCLRMPSVEMVRIMLGDSKLYPAHLIPPTRKTSGVGFTMTDSGFVKFRGAHEDEASRLQIAKSMSVWSEKYRKEYAAGKRLEVVA